MPDTNANDTPWGYAIRAPRDDFEADMMAAFIARTIESGYFIEAAGDGPLHDRSFAAHATVTAAAPDSGTPSRFQVTVGFDSQPRAHVTDESHHHMLQGWIELAAPVEAGLYGYRYRSAWWKEWDGGSAGVLDAIFGEAEMTEPRWSDIPFFPPVFHPAPGELPTNRPLTAGEVGEQLNKSPRQVRHLAALHGIGIKLGDDTWVFNAENVAALRALPETRGRKRKEPQP